MNNHLIFKLLLDFMIIPYIEDVMFREISCLRLTFDWYFKNLFM